MKIRSATILVAAISVVCSVLVGGCWYAETFSANRTATLLVLPKMTKSQVVDTLGVMYDEAKLGEYADVDAVIALMKNNETINRVCYWRIAYSTDRFWVGFDEDENVIATYLETNSP